MAYRHSLHYFNFACYNLYISNSISRPYYDDSYNQCDQMSRFQPGLLSHKSLWPSATSNCGGLRPRIGSPCDSEMLRYSTTANYSHIRQRNSVIHIEAGHAEYAILMRCASLVADICVTCFILNSKYCRLKYLVIQKGCTVISLDTFSYGM